jgi:hypothetical protein
MREHYRSANDAQDRRGSVEAREGKVQEGAGRCREVQEGAGPDSLLPMACGGVTQQATSNYFAICS